MGIRDYIGGSADDVAIWDGTFDFTVDDFSLLRAIRFVDGFDEGHELSPSGRDTMESIRRHIINKPAFKIILENEHLRGLLKTFLEDNIHYADVRSMLMSERQRNPLTRLLRRSIIQNLEVSLKDLEAKRDESFKKYEMLRRLTDWDNKLLMRIPS